MLTGRINKTENQTTPSTANVESVENAETEEVSEEKAPRTFGDNLMHTMRPSGFGNIQMKPTSGNIYTQQTDTVGATIMRTPENQTNTENSETDELQEEEAPLSFGEKLMRTMRPSGHGNIQMKTNSEELETEDEYEQESNQEFIKNNIQLNDTKLNDGDFLEKMREKKAKKHIKKGQEIINADPYNPEIPYNGNPNGLSLKLKRRWVKEKYWIYYAKYLEDVWHFPPINSYEEFLKLDKNTSEKYFNVSGYSGGNNSSGNKNDKNEVKSETKEKIKGEEKNIEVDIEKKEEKKEEEPKQLDNQKTDIVPVIDSKRKVIKIAEHDEKKIKYRHYDAIKIFKNDTPGENISGKVELDPNQNYVVFIRGYSLKDKVTIYVSGNKVGGDEYFQRYQRFYLVPANSNNVEIYAEADKDSSLEIEINYAKQKQITMWKTIKTTYYSDGFINREVIKEWQEVIDTPFTTHPMLAGSGVYIKSGEERIIWKEE